LQKIIKDAVKLTKNNSAGVLNIALNYGGRAEIVHAIIRIVKEKKV